MDREKSRLRQVMRNLRAAIPLAERAQAAEKIRDFFLSQIPLPSNSVIAGYWPTHDECDPRPLMTALSAQGHRICLPVITGKNQPLEFSTYTMGDALVSGMYDIPAPAPTAARVQPDIVLVPLLAFDSAGQRLGYGGGYYDRTLAALRAQQKIMAVGIAYAGQELPALPAHDGDQCLDAVLTEAGVRFFQS